MYKIINVDKTTAISTIVRLSYIINGYNYVIVNGVCIKYETLEYKAEVLGFLINDKIVSYIHIDDIKTVERKTM